MTADLPSPLSLNTWRHPMTRLDAIEARLDHEDRLGIPYTLPNSESRYLLKVARVAERCSTVPNFVRASAHSCWATERLDLIRAALEAPHAD